jgi:hypothetical protein
MAEPVLLAFPSAVALVRAGIWTYSLLAALGVVLALSALVDGVLNLRAVQRLGNGRHGAAWLWLGIAATALIAQAKLAIIGAVVVLRPARPLPPDQLAGDALLVLVFLIGGLAVLGIQVATIAGRSALRHRPPE